jgi:D-beta-D-heptose 7-phosphate kinase/D-beta-D-heptose 1-phosphate adenosyltransferase
MNHSEILNKIKGLKVAVIGDMMIDEVITGLSTRLSPEAPVPVIDRQSRTITPGGAANVAMNVSALGADVTLFTQPGDDRDAGILVDRMRLAGIQVNYEPGFERSIRKCRVVSNGEQVCRIDTGGKLSAPLIISLGVLKNFDLVILSDYGYGALSQEMVDAIPIDRKYIVVADPKPRSGIIFRGVDVITPNLKEIHELSPLAGTKDAMRHIHADWGVGNVIVTRGQDDTLVDYGDAIASIPTEGVLQVDPCGAGDTFVAAISLAMTGGVTILVATTFANKVAAIAVCHRGTYMPSREDILRG